MPKTLSIHSETGYGKLTLWDFADPAAAVKAAIQLYGSDAATAAAWCALTANFDGREEDYRFWCAVFSKLGKKLQA
ncbi:hypothetical protein LB542_16055 [Mesorhizobium sp. BR1-1-9]|uniref:hypothetical protein n=1 Tax=unclassified Mesorhizobium TaxID=325217 RepID=UPI00112EA540|nr:MULTISPECIES: hypothetical protein [unclassified Mesorhizobium]MBZ9811129.1 hypothetical protein [Mesorhizobium sp. ESP-6-2]MBZ9872363.1 hypothetical protein [Mesorhizobium sp. BR1-1-9]MBZ9944703.1 hypothetical protein [Mesorhizobium sp. BR1-1-13]TPM22574.1 hypothetical protein FJ955_28385 [Mesorhizobium sp. B2-2-2]